MTACKLAEEGVNREVSVMGVRKGDRAYSASEVPPTTQRHISNELLLTYNIIILYNHN